IFRSRPCGLLESGREPFPTNKFIIPSNDGYGIIFNALHCKDYIKMYIALPRMKGFPKEARTVVT
ncbi:hypothetical protein, partial [Klebsiella pneumoniae]